jgi:hypothetical protein
MRRFLAFVLLSSACMLCGQAKAVTFTESFDELPLGTANFANGILTWTPSTPTAAQIVVGSSAGQDAAPVGDTSNYLSVFGGSSSTETITLNPGLVGQSFGLLIGSLDTFNSISFYDGGSTPVASFTGSQIASMFGMAANGDPTSTASNGNVAFQNIGPFTSVVLGSTSNSFEVDDVTIDYSDGSLAPAVPEASTWVMMILGFLSVGLVGYRRTGLSLRLV